MHLFHSALGIGIPNMNKIESIKRFYFPYPSSKLFSIAGAMLNAMNFMENLKNLFFSRLRRKIFVVTGYYKILQQQYWKKERFKNS